MNFNLSTFQNSPKLHYYFSQLHYFSLLSFALLLPYWGAWKIIKLLLLVIFFSSLFSNKVNFKSLLANKVIIALFTFILFTYISFLWSPADIIFSEEFKMAINRYKYFFLLIPGIYFSSLSKNKIKTIIFTMALAPVGTAVVYYLNAFNITDIYPIIHGGDSSIFAHYLANNFFLTFSAIYFLHLSINSFRKKEIKEFTLFFLLFVLFVSSMVIDPRMSSRLTLLVFIVVALITPLFYLKRNHSIILFIISVLFLTFFMNTNSKMKQGINTFNTAIEENKYTGSWGHRLGFLIVGIDIFKEHPVMGRGVCDVRSRVVTYSEENPEYFINDPARHFHNEHLHILVEVGIIGYLIYLGFIFLFLKIPVSDPLLNKLKYTYTIAFLLMQFGEHYLTLNPTALFIGLFFILIVLYNEKDKEEQIQKITQ